MMVYCPGCGGRNAREATSCEWCHRSFLPTARRGLSARWWGALSLAIIVVLLLLVAGLAYLNAARSTERPTTPSLATPAVAAASASPSPTTPRPTPSPSPSATPAPPTPTPAPLRARVANTGGLGANLRSEPAPTSAALAALAERSVVQILGPEQRGPDGRIWRLVEDSRGRQGWVPADFLEELPAER